MAREWLKKSLPALSNAKHRIQVENTLAKYAYPKLGKRPINQISRTELVQIVQEVQNEAKRGAAEGVGGKVENAHRVAGRITAIFDYAQDAGYLQIHPASHLTRVLVPRKVKKPMASIQPEQAGELMRKIADYPAGW